MNGHISSTIDLVEIGSFLRSHYRILHIITRRLRNQRPLGNQIFVIMGLLDSIFTNWQLIVMNITLLWLSIVVWHRYLSPLRRVPGPFVASFSRFWHIHHILKGDQDKEFLRIHEKYGMLWGYLPWRSSY